METVSFISDDIEEIKKEQKKQQAIHSLLPSFMGVKLLLIRRSRLVAKPQDWGGFVCALINDVASVTLVQHPMGDIVLL